MTRHTTSTLWIVHFTFMILCAIFVGLSLSALHSTKTATGSITFSISSSPELTMNMNFDVGTNTTTYLGTTTDAKVTGDGNVLIATIDNASNITVTITYNGSLIECDSSVMSEDGTSTLTLGSGTMSWSKTTTNGTDTVTLEGVANAGDTLVIDKILCAVHPVQEVNNQAYTIKITAQEGESIQASATISGKYSSALQDETVTFNVSTDTNYGTVTSTIASIQYGTTYTVDGNSITFDGTNSTTITATPQDSGAQYTYSFSSWQIGGQIVASGTIGTVRDDMTFTANFTRSTNNYVVTFTSNNSSYGTVSSSTGDTQMALPYGTTYSVSDNILAINGATFIATPVSVTSEYVYKFSHWSAGETILTTGQNYTIIGTTTITANFIRENNSITVTIISNNTNYGTVSQGSVIVPYGTTYSGTINVITFNDTSGTQVNITATPATSTAKYKYDFSGWSVNSGTLGDAITAPITLTANFTQSLQYYTVTFKTNSTVSSISHQSISVPYGTTFTQVGTGLEFYYDDELLYTISVIWQNTRNYYISPSSGTIEGDLTISLGTN